MNKSELEFLFKKYLNRGYTPTEFKIHSWKDKTKFEKELLNCEEYLNLKKTSNGNSESIHQLKVAIILSGHVRKNLILNSINKFFNHQDCDIFIHTWDNLGIKGSETNLSDKLVPEKVLSEIKKYKNLKDYKIETNSNWIELQKDTKNYFNLSSPEPFIKSQLYSINMAYQIMDDYSKKNNIEYDIVFRFRFDCDITDFNLSNTTIEDIKKNDIIFVPNSDCKHDHMDYGTSCWACDNMYYKYKRKLVHIFEHTNVICDIFAYGSKKSMKKYCDLYHNYDKLNKSFFKENLIYYEKINKNIEYIDGNYLINQTRDGHIDSLYYYYCSYPERLLPKFLKDYMLIESKDVKIKFTR